MKNDNKTDNVKTDSVKTGGGRLTRRGFVAAGAGLAALGFSRPAVAADGENDKLITKIAKIKLDMANEDKALKALRELCAAVEKNEPGVLVYICHRNAKKHDEVVFFEVYQDEAAFNAHTKTAHFRKFFRSFGTLFKLPLELTTLDRVGGYARGSGHGA
jgi:quinol monooxygenase YgiN